MKSYNLDIESGVHTVKITLQNNGYVGHIIQKVSGNCKGRDMLDFNFENEEDSDLLPENDCQLEYNEDYNIFRCVLVNAVGSTLECEGDAEEMNDMIVAIEIIDFTEE